jgi:hypothetical protein
MALAASWAADPSYMAHFLEPTRLAPLTIAVPLAGTSGDSPWFSSSAAERPAREALARF